MNSIKTIIINDEPRGVASLQKLLQLNCPEVEVIAVANSAKEAKDKILQMPPQLIFLDIAMPGKSGFELLKDLGEINFEIIFVTAHNNFMVQAFHFSAVDYLLKPVDDELLAEAVKRTGKRIEEKKTGQQVETLLLNIQHKNNSQKMKLCIPSLKGFQVVEIQDIIYCEASTNYTNFHFTQRASICASKPIHDYEELLGDCSFVRIHKSYFVNLEHIKEYIRGEGGSVILSNNHEVEVSRRKIDLLMTRMKEFYKF
ncbi:MAG: LytTR family DNA-binding domain-containing protein [Bacteroidota bacterium]|nr:LytTR family DNA-binding domain-containing protein [Bacteroidota bacterium]